MSTLLAMSGCRGLEAKSASVLEADLKIVASLTIVWLVVLPPRCSVRGSHCGGERRVIISSHRSHSC